MAAEVQQLQYRVEELEQENAALTQEVQRLKLYVDHDSQALERRLISTNERVKTLGEEKYNLSLAKDRLEKDLATITDELLKAKTASEEKDTILLQKEKEVNEERKLRSALDRAADRREADFRELELRFKNLQEKVIQLTKDKNEAESVAQEARSQATTATLAQSELESKLKHHAETSEALEKETSTLRQRYRDVRFELDNKVMELTAKLDGVTREAESIKKDLEREKALSGSLQEKLQDRNQRIKQLQDEAADREKDYESRTRLKDDLIQTLTQYNGELEITVGSLRGVITQMKEELQKTQEAMEEGFDRLKEENDVLKQQLQEHEQQRQRILEAAASGQLPLGPGTPTRETPDDVDTNVSRWSKLELYNKFMDTSAKLREEQSNARKYEIILHQIQHEIEKKAVQVQEQYQEHVQLQQAHATISSSLRDMRVARHELQTQLAALRVETERSARRTRRLEEDLQDRSRQVASLLREVTLLKEGRPPTGGLQSPGNTGAIITAADVVTDRLVVFRNMDELQEVNAKQLSVIRDLTDELERTREEVSREFKAQYDLELARVERQLEDMAKMRNDQQELVEQITRQRDLYRTLLAEAGGDLAAAAASPGAAAVGILRRSLGAPSPAPDGPDWQKLYQQLEKEKEAALKDASDALKGVRLELKEQTERVIDLKAVAQTADSLADFYKKETERYAEMLDASEKDKSKLNSEAVIARDAAHKSEESLRAERSKTRSLSDEISELKSKKVELETDLAIRAARIEELQAKERSAIEERVKVEVSQKMDGERFKLIEASHKETISSLTARLQQAHEDLEEALAAKADLVKKANEMDKAREAADQTAFVRLPELEAEVKNLKEQLETEKLRAANAEGKFELVQKSLQAAEERAATLELQSKSRATTSMDESVDLTSAQKDAEIKLLQEEVNRYQVQLASQAGSVASYKALAASAEEALNAAQNEHRKFRGEVEQQNVQHSEEVKKLETELAGLQKELEEKSSLLLNLEQQLDDAQRWKTEIVRKVQEDAKDMQKTTADVHSRISTLEKELAFKKKEVEDWQNRFESQVDALNLYKRDLNAAKSEREEVERKLQAKDIELADALQQLGALKSNFTEEGVRVSNDLRAAQDRITSLERENGLLIKQLSDTAEAEKAKGSGPLSENVEMSELVQHLKREKDVLKGQLAVEKSERTALEKKLEIKERELNLARSDLETAALEERSRIRQEGEFKANQEYIVDNANLREANKNLRDQRARVDKEKRELELRVRARMEDLRKKSLEVIGLETALKAAKEKAEEATKEGDKWAEKVRDMMTKKIDLAEHEKIVEQLNEAKQRISEVEKAANQRVSDSEKAAEQKVLAIEKAHSEKVSDLEARLKAAHEATKTEVQKRVYQAMRVMKHICGPSPGKVTPETAQAAYDAKMKRLQEVEEAAKGLQETVTKLQAELKEKDSTYKTLQGEIDSLKQKNEQALSGSKRSTAFITKLQGEISEQYKIVKSLKAERDSLQSTIRGLENRPAAVQASTVPSEGPTLAREAPIQEERRHTSIPSEVQPGGDSHQEKPSILYRLLRPLLCRLLYLWLPLYLLLCLHLYLRCQQLYLLHLQ
eukprot:jgi/Botrbrau1/22807/Bobra.0132s0132.1